MMFARSHLAYFFLSIVLMMIYVVASKQIAWAALPVPTGWLRLGVGLGLMCISLLLWDHGALRRNPSAPGVINANQWMCHPIYTLIFLLVIAYFLISANWIIGGLQIGWIVGTRGSMLPDEETALIESFGSAYQAYMQRTGRFLSHMF
jgi:protein-S-isoprenylcysteine O-methyltransferase Ste14